MKIIKGMFRALVGLALIFIYHIPHLIYLVLQVSYAYVFNNPKNLTASPQEHLKRARKLLKRGFNSELLYAAIELRFALERMVHWELMMAEMASNRMLKENHPAKKLSSLHYLNSDSAYFHEIYLVNKETGEKVRWGTYKPLDKALVTTIQGRLGDILHPKYGLFLGVVEDPWYHNTRKFLRTSIKYLETIQKDNQHFFAFYGRENFEMVKIDDKEA